MAFSLTLGLIAAFGLTFGQKIIEIQIQTGTDPQDGMVDEVDNEGTTGALTFQVHKQRFKHSLLKLMSCSLLTTSLNNAS